MIFLFHYFVPFVPFARPRRMEAIAIVATILVVIAGQTDLGSPNRHGQHAVA